MMQRWLSRRQTALLVTAAVTACSRLRHGASPRTEATSEPELAPMQLGQRVVVENATASFVEGTVTAVVQDRAHVTLAAGNVLEQGLADLYVPETSSAPGAELTAKTSEVDAGSLAGEERLREGEYGVCHMPEGRWRGCRIEAIGRVVRVLDEEAILIDLPVHEVLAATPVTALNVRQRFARNARRRVFREGAKSAGQPKVPCGWRPVLNEYVLARREGGWMAAQVKGWRVGWFRVEWMIDHRLSEVPTADLAPQPPIDFAPTIGTYVLVRPLDDVSAWSVLRIESSGWQSLGLSDETGAREGRPLRDVVPLEPGGG